MFSLHDRIDYSARMEKWASLSEAEKSAYRAAVWPDSLDDKGREWRMGMIADLQDEVASLKAEIAKLKGE